MSSRRLRAPTPRTESDLKSLAEAASEPILPSGLAGLEKVLDLDRFITCVAMDVMTCDWDGYASTRIITAFTMTLTRVVSSSFLTGSTRCLESCGRTRRCRFFRGWREWWRRQ